MFPLQSDAFEYIDRFSTIECAATKTKDSLHLFSFEKGVLRAL